MFDPARLITDRLLGIDASGIRRAFDLAASLDDPINLSIGLPDFDVPELIKDEAARAIAQGMNRYTQTQGAAALRDRVTAELVREFPRTLGTEGEALPKDTQLLITSGVSGALMLLMLTCTQPGDEVLIPDPYFVMYKHLVTLAGATPVYVDTYPDFRVTADRVAPHITQRTKLLLLNSPSNPTGVVAGSDDIRDLIRLCDQAGVLLVSDEIYDAFCHDKSDRGDGFGPRLASPLETSRSAMLLRGFSKTYAMTGWRLGYALGPQPIVEQMTKLQQYSFVCAPSPMQVAAVAALDVDMSEYIQAYRRKRDRVVETLSPHFELTNPGGAFYAFPKVPDHLGMTATQFIEKAIGENVIVIPGSVFSQRDTHFRISYAADDATLDRGLNALVKLATA